MSNFSCQTFALDVLVMLATRGEQTSFSYQNPQLFIDGQPAPHSSASWPVVMRDTRAKFFLEKIGLIGADLTMLGEIWEQELQQSALSGQQLRKLGEKTLSASPSTEDVLSHWRRMIEAHLMESIPDLEYVEHLSPTTIRQAEQPLELAPLLRNWPERLLNHPHWSCAESPLPEIPPLPLDEVWVDLQVTEPAEYSSLLEDRILPQAMEQRYRETQWANIPADFVLESLKGTMVLVGAPGIGKTTLMKWIARRLIQKPQGRYLLPLFVPLRAYALSKAQQPSKDLLSFALEYCGVRLVAQIEKWSTAISYLSGPERNNVLLLLDGWDEVPNDARELLITEIQHLGYGFGIIITSRPSAYPKALQAEQLYEISDLPPENIAALVRRWHEVMQQSRQADVLLAHLDDHPDLRRLARNPFLLNLLCAINIENAPGTKPLPRNRTELYTHTLDHIYSHHTRKYPDSPFTRQHIRQTQELALWLLAEAPNHPQYLFGTQEVEQATGDTTLLANVLKPSRLLSQWNIDRESLHFLHTTFQEYLAAEALILRDSSERTSLITRELFNPAWQEILRFIAGRNADAQHDFWKIIRQLAQEPDQCGLIDIRLSQLVAETGETDGGQALLGYDLRDRLWQHIKSDIGTDFFVDAYAQLDPEDYVKRVRNAGDITSKPLKTRLLRSLGKIRTRQSSQALVDSLLFGDKDTAAVASYAVKNVLDATDLQMLRLAAQDNTLPLSTRQMLVRALGNKKDYASIPLLVRLLDGTPALRQEILRALGGIGGQEAAHALGRLLQTTTDPEFKHDIVNALGRAFDLPARDALITELAGIMPDDPLADDIMEALCEIPIARHSGLISLYLDTAFPEHLRVQAIWALMEATETHITEKLARLGESDPSEKVRITALAALRKRARSFDLTWLSSRIQDADRDLVERANALEAVLGLYKRHQQGQTSSHLDHHTLHEWVLKLTKLGLSRPSGDLSETAAASAYVLGKDIAEVLLEVCENKAFSASVRESACTSLGKIKYKPALRLLLTWIGQAPGLLDDEEMPLTENDDRLARAAAEAFVLIDLESAAQHVSQTVKVAVGKFALENGYLIFPERILSPDGSLLAGKPLHIIPVQEAPVPTYRILLLAANPSNTDDLRLQAEFRDIIESLKLSLRDGFQIQPCLATRPKDLRRAMLDYNPHIIHFSGHASNKGICLEDDNGQATLVGNTALANLFALFDKQIRCVVLNACHSSTQAAEIAKHVPYVIGMKDSVTDKAARTFSLGFYDALFRGCPINDAFHMGCNAVELEGIPENELPILLQNLQQ